MVFLIIDDDPDHRLLLERMLSTRESFMSTGGGPRQVRSFAEPAEAVANFPAEGPVVVLCDYQMPGCSGSRPGGSGVWSAITAAPNGGSGTASDTAVAVAEPVTANHTGDGLDWLPDFARFDLGPVIVLSSHGDEKIAARAFHAGASDYLTKSAVFKNPQLLHHAIRDGLRRHRLDARNRRLSEELKHTNVELESKNKRLTELTDTAHRFVDNVAHEFRTPLTVIKEFASIIRDGLGGPVTPDQEGFLDYIDAATRDLSQMVDDFLDTSKLRANRLRVDRKQHCVGELFDQVRQTALTRAMTKSVHIEEVIAEDLPPIFCDLEKAGRALLNLVTNAIKFSPEGSTVRLEAAVCEATLCRGAGTAGDLRISVTDKGPGLSIDDIAVIGERFEQGKPTRHKKAGKGFGLGLHIAKELARLNLGQMDIDSELGAGSTFSFTLPTWNPRHVVRRYGEVMRSGDDSQTYDICMMELTAVGQDICADTIREFLASVGYSMDLALPDAKANSVLLLGSCEQPERWAEKLRDAWDARSIDLGEDVKLAELTCRHLDTYTLPRDLDQLTDATAGRLEGARHCA